MAESNPYKNTRWNDVVDYFRDVNGNICFDLAVGMGALGCLAMGALLMLMGAVLPQWIAMAVISSPMIPFIVLAGFLARESHRENKHYRSRS